MKKINNTMKISQLVEFVYSPFAALILGVMAVGAQSVATEIVSGR